MTLTDPPREWRLPLLMTIGMPARRLCLRHDIYRRGFLASAWLGPPAGFGGECHDAFGRWWIFGTSSFQRFTFGEKG
jgi:hypothetical protein